MSGERRQRQMCSLCHQEGHNRRTCPSVRGPEPEANSSPKPAPLTKPFEDLGEPPESPLELATWAARMAAVALHQAATGQGDPTHLARVRDLAKAVGNLIPDHVVATVKRQLDDKKKGKSRKPKKRKKGPEPEPASGSRRLKG